MQKRGKDEERDGFPDNLDPLEEFHFLPQFSVFFLLLFAGLSLVLGLCLVIGGLLVLFQFRGLVERVIKSVSDVE